MLSVFLGLAVVVLLVIIAGLVQIIEEERADHARSRTESLATALQALRSSDRLGDAGQQARADLLAAIREAGSGG